MLISHDATLVVAALVEAGGRCDLRELEREVSPRLTHCFALCWTNLLDTGLAQQLRGALELRTRIAQMTVQFDDSAPGFWYKNHNVIGGFGVLIWLTRWVKGKQGF